MGNIIKQIDDKIEEISSISTSMLHKIENEKLNNIIINSKGIDFGKGEFVRENIKMNLSKKTHINNMNISKVGDYLNGSIKTNSKRKKNFIQINISQAKYIKVTPPTKTIWI